MNAIKPPLKYPHDRYNGYVELSLNSKFYVPYFSREHKNISEFQNYKDHWRAWRELCRRRFGKQFEPCSISNMDKFI